MHFPVVMSQSRINLSSEPEARTLESGLQAMQEMPARCPSSVWAKAPVLESHTLIVASAAAIRQYHGITIQRRCILTAASDELSIR